MNDDEFDDLFNDEPAAAAEGAQPSAAQQQVTAPAPAPAAVTPVARPLAAKQQSKPATRTGFPLWAKITLPIAGVVLLVLGLVIGVSIGAASAPKAKPIKRATAIKSQSSVIKNLESLKDAQLKAVNDKLLAVRMASASPDQKLQGFGLLAQDLAADQASIDKMLTSLYALKPTADTGAKETVRKDIAQYMTPDAGSTVAYNAVSGKLPGRMLQQAGVRSAPSIILPWKFTVKGAVYVVITPFTTEQGTSYAVSVIGVANNGGVNSAGAKGRLVYDYRFTGVLTGTEVGSVEKAIAAMADGTERDYKPQRPDAQPGAQPQSDTQQPPIADTAAATDTP